MSELAADGAAHGGNSLTVQDTTDPWGTDPDDRWVMIRAEICGSGLWHADGSADQPEGLPPIPVALVDRLEAWAHWHDALDTANTSSPNSLFWEERADAPLAAFNGEGRAIAHALKAALPPDWTVVHQDIDAWLHKDRPVADFQLVLPGDPDVSRPSTT